MSSHSERARRAAAAAACLGIFGVGAILLAGTEWKIHDPDRPAPPVVVPGTPSTQRHPGLAPSDAVVLFDGSDLSRWRANDGGPAAWRIENGSLEVVPGAGMLWTREEFGDCQLHVEFSTPPNSRGRGQDRGNSGIYLMGRYEIQVLDSYENLTYADGAAAALYGQHPPLVNASRAPGEWQSYDVVFHGPRFDAAGVLIQPARATLLHNGVLAQDGAELTGPTEHGTRPPYQTHPSRLPLGLQDHGEPVRFRNIWIRELPGE